MRNIEVKQMPEYDVIVVGGGVAGVAAAVAASRNGAKTLLYAPLFRTKARVPALISVSHSPCRVQLNPLR